MEHNLASASSHKFLKRSTCGSIIIEEIRTFFIAYKPKQCLMNICILFFISKPDVFKSLNSETYIIFGEAKIADLSTQLQTQAAQKFRMPAIGSVMAKSDISALTAAAQPDEAEEREDEEIDETGVELRDIDLVMTQAGVSRSKALKTSNGDVVSAIMKLTT
ncbi:unnamed protein product [Fraxinus pennsylvanica]|uniref:Uncharacterized protein n=1 Tax=Fraxinus pennsylvanica TaxID=56036 RepID=A0AAD2DWV3_9LAMI|nr:unnamed protein product [Fraxinus pennsylvanica]